VSMSRSLVADVYARVPRRPAVRAVVREAPAASPRSLPRRPTTQSPVVSLSDDPTVPAGMSRVVCGPPRHVGTDCMSAPSSCFCACHGSPYAACDVRL